MLTYADTFSASFDEPVDTLQVKAHYNIAPDARIILSVGRLIPQKGVLVKLVKLGKFEALFSLSSASSRKNVQIFLVFLALLALCLQKYKY